ncbi:phosphoadenosine phosphosulfate reductase family protein [Erwinia phage Midgardsormr38]|uniref:Phosphoadenosine phosphosulfate reductase family protein n=1 Tax=Erwinia phage Midgardsormr38 TaxID=2663326 RepID=A0A5Q2F5J7_9CAUD|nr:phosphoadenosine phosphosulfate reductase family protein [Erwinia phage Midgardsormr38]QGF22038.1 phosphoadenosine phosphosulfate reductase family protein [Erwinia phage Midgardsormr38]
MKNIVSLSGGRTSAYLAHIMKEKDPETEFIFMDTGAEHPKTYEFIRNIVRHWKIRLTCLRVIPNPEMNKPSTYEILSIEQIGPDLEPWKRMLKKYGHPYVGGAFCTDRMKTVPFIKYCDEHFGRGNYTTWLGMRIDEPARLWGGELYKSMIEAGLTKDEVATAYIKSMECIQNTSPDWLRIDLVKEHGIPLHLIDRAMKRLAQCVKDRIRYLAEISDFEKQDVIEWWKEQPFDLEIQEHLGNCVFCIKKSLQKVALAEKDEPVLAAQFIQTLHDFDAKQDKVMYRSNNSLEQVIALFSDTGRDELASRMTSMRQYDTGSCSESCEAFSGQMGFDFSMEAA